MAQGGGAVGIVLGQRVRVRAVAMVAYGQRWYRDYDVARGRWVTAREPVDWAAQGWECVHAPSGVGPEDVRARRLWRRVLDGEGREGVVFGRTVRATGVYVAGGSYLGEVEPASLDEDRRHVLYEVAFGWRRGERVLARAEDMAVIEAPERAALRVLALEHSYMVWLADADGVPQMGAGGGLLTARACRWCGQLAGAHAATCVFASLNETEG